MSSHEIENRLRELEKLHPQMQQVWSALNAIIEQIELLKGGENNAVVEGDDVQPKATRNGKLRQR